MEVSSSTRRSASSGCSSPRRKPPLLGSVSSRRWIVRASRPVVSDSRLAARPVGAASSIRTPFAARMRRIALTIVVLPTPGPPVITSSFERSASATAARWLSASASPIRASTQGIARSASISPQGGRPVARARSRVAMPRSAACRPARTTQRVAPTMSATTVPSPSSSESASATSSGPTSSSSAASRRSSSSGRPQCPSSIASESA